jgi:nicotinamidase-related amidase
MTTGLILVDIQNDYFPAGNMELEGMNAAAARAADLLERFRDRGQPAFHVRHESVQPGATFFLPGSPGAEIHRRVTPAPGEAVVTKHFPNSFRETDLRERLEAAGVKQVVICGAMSHMCIDATTRAAADLGLGCTVIADACATREQEFGGVAVPAAQVHAAFMAALAAAYAAVLELDRLDISA